MTLKKILQRIEEITEKYQDVRVTFKRDSLHVSYHDYDRDIFAVETLDVKDELGSIPVLRRILNTFSTKNFVWTMEL